MNSKNTDILNSFLILISLALAFFLPFQLFLFSYAVLGPLHYLTEINWLKKKNYFITKPQLIWVFVFVAALISLPVLLKLPLFSHFNRPAFVSYLFDKINYHQGYILFLSLLFAAALVYFKKQKHIILFLLAGIIASILILKYASFSFILAGLFIPTLVHVYLFTLLFMIYGSSREKNITGVIAIVLLILCPFIILIIKVDPTAYQLSGAVKAGFFASGMQNVSSQLASVFGTADKDSFNLLSVAGIKIQVFIAFSYTYHYLNWFSKTSIIGWNKNVSKPKLLVILFLWAGAVLLYWFDYKTALMTLFFLSYLHVLLEFPLNITSIKGILHLPAFKIRKGSL